MEPSGETYSVLVLLLWGDNNYGAMIAEDDYGVDRLFEEELSGNRDSEDEKEFNHSFSLYEYRQKGEI